MDDIIYKWFVKIISGLNSLTIFVILFVKTLIYSSNFSFTKLENKKTQRNINKSQQEIIKKIDDIIYNYDKDDKKVKKYAENIKEIFEYEHYDYSKECIEEEFDFDLERAIIYSEILQKPLSLR